jgi:hypothetical protein
LKAGKPLALMAGWKQLAGNIILFQAGWFGCVLGAAHAMDGAGVGLAAAIVAWHLARSAAPRRELALVASVLAIGACWDSAVGLTGWLVFRRAWPAAWPAMLAPPWLLAVWALFATTLNVSLRWLRGRGWLAAALGALFGPLTYWGGARLGAATLVQAAPVLALLVAGWAALMPLLLAVARRIDNRALGATAAPSGGTAPAPPIARSPPAAQPAHPTREKGLT